MKFSNLDRIIFSVFAILIAIFWIFKDDFTSVFLIFFMGIGLLIAILASEKAVGGMEILGEKLGLTPYVSGVLSSLASNFPELVIGGFAILAGKVEFAIAFIIIATGFNILMLGLLVIIGNLKRKSVIILPDEVLEIEVPIVRVAIVIVGSIFVYGIVLFVLEVYEVAEGVTPQIPILPYEANMVMVLVYLFYLFFIIRHNLQMRKNSDPHNQNNSEDIHPESKISRQDLIFILVLAFTMIFFAGEMISSSVERFLVTSTITEFQLAFFIGAAASIPEHTIALLAVRKEKEGIELGLGNLIAGSMQNLLLMTGLVSLFSYVGYILDIHRESNLPNGIPLIHEIHGEQFVVPMPFLLVQFGFAWLLLALIKSSMTDDKRLDIYEGFTITIAQIFVFVIFLRGILGF
jgi:Ca2+/Na+ antiporter